MEKYRCPKCLSEFSWRTQKLTECPYCFIDGHVIELEETTETYDPDKAYDAWKDEQI